MRSGEDDGGILRPIRHGLRLQSTRASDPFKPRFAMSRNINHRQFGKVYERDPEPRVLSSGHFTGGPVGVYTPDTAYPGSNR